MEKQKKSISNRINFSSVIIVLLCVLISIGVIFDLVFVYRPDQNALGALGTVCLDVISMIVMLILIISMTFEKKEFNKTTKLYIALLLGTMVALFFDFLTWASDGSLAFGDWTYVFTISSLCCGSILACILSMYINSYVKDMYNLERFQFSSKICVGLNLIAFLITAILGSTKQAFDFVDGHYKPGALYDVITVIPILTLIYMAGLSIRFVKIIGIHDAIGVAGYIFTMICGAIIESVYGVGATYVSIAIADVFIFLMLQNKIFDTVKKQKEFLDQQISSQYEILASMADIYTHVNYVDLVAMTEKKFNIRESTDNQLDLNMDSHTSLNKNIWEGIADEYKDEYWAFTDLLSLSERMMGKKIISAEVYHNTEGWIRAHYIRIGDYVDVPLQKAIYVIRNIDEEKKNVEKWIQKSNTDELTGFYNRHAYEDAITLLEEDGLNDNFVYISIDINGLKTVNDNLGHAAGDELIIGASECLKQCLGVYGDIFRIGGDEFVAIIYADDIELSKIKNDLDEVSGKWSGKFNEHLALSCGYVTKADATDMTLHQIAVLADKRMYEEKSKYYRRKGVDRRGQRDAHVALCALYTKILKINVSEDTYQIINMNTDEQSEEMGFAGSISEWLSNFGTSGQVHPEDLETYLAKTNISYMSDYFKQNQTPLHIFYRRKYDEKFVPVMMEIIKANDYAEDSQSLFLYVKKID